MSDYEYKVVPAPKKGEKAKGARSTEARFANALARLMNELGAEGWEYLRAEALPCEERVGFRGVKLTEQNMLIFRRQLPADAEAHPMDAVDAPAPARERHPIIGALASGRRHDGARENREPGLSASSGPVPAKPANTPDIIAE